MCFSSLSLLRFCALLLVAAFRGGWAADQEGTLSEWGSLGWVTLGLVLNVVLIEWIGFILSSTLLFACVARGFGSGRWLRDGAIGLLLGLGVFLFFVRFLNVNLPAGWLRPILGGAGL